MPGEQNDHDILIELRTEMIGLRRDVNDIKDTTKTTLQDHETRLRLLEKIIEQGRGAERVIAGFIGFSGGIIAALIIKYILHL